MSLDSEIAQLTGSANTLIDTFQQKEDAIGQAVNAALAAIPEGYKVYFVDQQFGSDDNDGISAETALKSVEEAIDRTPVGGVLYLQLCSDYTMEKEVVVNNKTLRITALNGGPENKINLSFGVKESGGEIKTNGFVSLYNGGIHLEFIRINMPDTTGLTGTEGLSSSCFGPRASGHAVQYNFKLTYSEIIVPNNTVSLLNSASSMIFVVLLAASYPAEMAGRWFRGVAAGTQVDSINNIFASGISTL